MTRRKKTMNDFEMRDLFDQVQAMKVRLKALEDNARQKSPDAQLKMQQAQAHYNRIKGRLSKTSPIVFGAIEPEGYQPRGPVLIARTS